MWSRTENKYAVTCFCCGVPKAANLGVSKIGWPFISCTSCKARAFLNSAASLAVLRETDADVVARLEADFSRARTAPTDNQLAALPVAVAKAG